MASFAWMHGIPEELRFSFAFKDRLQIYEGNLCLTRNLPNRAIYTLYEDLSILGRLQASPKYGKNTWLFRNCSPVTPGETTVGSVTISSLLKFDESAPNE